MRAGTRSGDAGTSAVITALVEVLEIFNEFPLHSIIQPVGG
jgi:hypothetical protein